MDASILKPCPLCGSEAQMVWLNSGRALMDALIRCTRCGLTLEWHTEFFINPPINIDTGGRPIIMKVSLDPFEAWNRRTKA